MRTIMTERADRHLEKSAQRLLAELAGGARLGPAGRVAVNAREAEVLVAADLAASGADGRLRITAAGRAHLRRAVLVRTNSPVDPFRAQHLDLVQTAIRTPEGPVSVTRDETESPLVWLARRKGRDGQPLITPHQLQAGERLRSVFTRSQLMPRTTANWDGTVSERRRGGGVPATFAEAVVAARQHLRQALAAAGPEFSGLLLDVCCFLKRLEEVERDRGWPARSAKVVLQLALDRLARHYGLGAEARGPGHAPLRTWLAPGAEFGVEQS
jgi:hypothetical protein